MGVGFFLLCGDIVVGGRWNNGKNCGSVKTKTQLVLQITQRIVTACIYELYSGLQER